MDKEIDSKRNVIKRGRKRGVNDIEVAYNIIDDNLLCHVSQIKTDFPIVTPTCHWRDGNRLYWHGHVKAFNVAGSKDQQVCINISQLDGLVLARSAFHHSVNYRSVTLFGKANVVEDEKLKEAQLKIFVEKISPGRWDKLRPIAKKELMMTGLAWILIDEYSVKVRAEGVNDDENDLSWPVGAGVIPIKSQLLPFVSETCEDYSLPSSPQIFNYIPFGGA